jgi:hypothetical protein
MFNREQLSRIEAQLIRIERKLNKLLGEFNEFEDERLPPDRMQGVLDQMNNATKFTVTEFDVNGKIIPIDLTKTAIKVASDNLAAATIDGAKGVSNPDGSVTYPVTSVAGATGVANITAVDPANLDANGQPLAAVDVDNVVAPALPPVKLTGVLS